MWVALYFAAIVLVNWLFAPAQLVPGVTVWTTGLGDLYLANIVVGFVFVLRDYAQRQVGHKVLLATFSAAVAAGVVTYFIAGPVIALASVAAFVLSEMADWAVYSFSRCSMSQRILISSIIAVPLDTLVFQHMAGYLTPAAFITEVASKAVGVLIVWYLLRLRDRKLALPA